MKPSDEPINILVVDDDAILRRTITRVLTKAGFKTFAAESAEAALELLADQKIDVVLLDVVLPGIHGIEALGQIKQRHPGVEVVMMTGYADLGMAVEAVRKGAQDFLAKPFGSNELILLAVEKAMEHAKLVATARASHEESALPPLVGRSETMLKVCQLAREVAATTASVLLLGETGTGKEVVARAIHGASPRCNQAFVPTNCSAIPQELVESELFGHEKGAFTGATRSRPGLFQRAHNGTLFLDEIGDLPLLGQAKLLRALQSGEVRSVGADVAKKVDVRVIAATNADLRADLKEGRFREDLFYRLNVVTIHIPSLAKRRDDIPLLAHHFVKKHAERLGVEPKRFSQDALWHLMQYDWPGNVRQLENTIERALIVTHGDSIRPQNLKLGTDLQHKNAPTPSQPPPMFASPEVMSLPFAEAKKRAVLEFEARYIEHLLKETNGNISEAARRSGLDRTNFRRILRRSKSS